MSEEDIPKTAVTTPFGSYEFKFMGLKNAPQSFQRVMDDVLRHIKHARAYLDDILIATREGLSLIHI